MTNLFPLSSTEQGHVFLVPRDTLTAHIFFQAMLTNDPPSLYLPFPAAVVSHIVGRLLHGDSWTLPEDPNVRLGLHYCQLIESVPLIQTKQLAPEATMAELIDSLVFKGVPQIFTGMPSGYHHLTAAANVPYVLVGLRRPFTRQVTFFTKEGDKLISIFGLNQGTYGLAFDICADIMVLKPIYLQLIREKGALIEISGTYDVFELITVQDRI